MSNCGPKTDAACANDLEGDKNYIKDMGYGEIDLLIYIKIYMALGIEKKKTQTPD